MSSDGEQLNRIFSAPVAFPAESCFIRSDSHFPLDSIPSDGQENSSPPTVKRVRDDCVPFRQFDSSGLFSCAGNSAANSRSRPECSTRKRKVAVITEALLRVGLEPCAGYRLRELRGQGSFGCVWEAETSRGQAVALKFLSCADGITTRQEIRAIQRVSQLRHAHLVPVEQVWCWQNYVVVTMPLADGSLLDLLEAYQDEYGGAMT